MTGAFPERPAISLCVVVRNEAAFLGACLESARPLVAEMIVVDTGSTDQTASIASAAGAEVFHEPWPGDLGRAHDLPLAHARGDWILTLDGDEVLDPARRNEIPALCRATTHSGLVFTCRNYQYLPQANWIRCDAREPLARGAPGWVPSRAVRLWRHQRRLRHQGTLHQDIGPSIEANGGTIGTCDVPIHHYGFLRTDRDKTAFYVDLAARHARARRDAKSWIELGVALGGSDEEGALAAFERSRELGCRTEGAYYLGRLLNRRGQPSDALARLDEGLAELERSEPLFVDRTDLLQERGRALDLLGQKEAAIATLRQALELRPGAPIAQIDLCGLLIECEELEQAQPLLDELLREHPTLATAWAQATVFALARGDRDRAVRCAARALELDRRDPVHWINLAVALRMAGRTAEGLRVYRAATELEGGEALERASELAAPSPSPAASGGRRQRGDHPTVVSVVSELLGGEGRLVADLAKALQPELRYVVLTEDAGALAGQGFRELIEKTGARVESIGPRGRRRALEAAAPALVLFHGPQAIDRPQPLAREPWIAIGQAPIPLPAGFDRYVVLSEVHRRMQKSLPPDRVVCIPGALPSGCVSTRPSSPSPTGGRAEDDRARGPVLVMLGSLEPPRFPRRLLDYLPDLGRLDATLIIAGAGGRRWELEPEIAAAGLTEHIRFVGPVAAPEVTTFLDRADVGLVLTEIHEPSFSHAALEMMSAGLPVVAHRRGSLAEQIGDGVTGYLISSEAEARLRIAQLLGSRPLRERLGAFGRRLVAARSADGFDEAWRRLIRACLDGPPS